VIAWFFLRMIVKKAAWRQIIGAGGNRKDRRGV
jgi:hypothetical protein